MSLSSTTALISSFGALVALASSFGAAELVTVPILTADSRHSPGTCGRVGRIVEFDEADIVVLWYGVEVVGGGSR